MKEVCILGSEHCRTQAEKMTECDSSWQPQLGCRHVLSLFITSFIIVRAQFGTVRHMVTFPYVSYVGKKWKTLGADGLARNFSHKFHAHHLIIYLTWKKTWNPLCTNTTAKSHSVPPNSTSIHVTVFRGGYHLTTVWKTRMVPLTLHVSRRCSVARDLASPDIVPSRDSL